MNKSPSIEIVDYQPKHQQAFRELNKAWIEIYFVMEEADYKALDHPNEYILQKGGAIIVALCDNEVAGVCALIKLNDEKYDYELAKMAVSPKFQGKGIGFILGEAVIEKAKQLNSKAIYLESNTILKPAINLYYKLGFIKVEGLISPYERCNIQMELMLN
jgi:GNAT superfamily N-acetyltransferase